MSRQLRIARPVSDLARATAMYCRGLGLRVVGSFEDHDGFDGVMLAPDDSTWHFEFTHCRTHPVTPSPTPEDLFVLYIPVETEWEERCAAMSNAGFREVASFNPYWDVRGRTFQDPDGYRVVLERAGWSNQRK